MPQGFVSFAEVKRAVPMESVLAHYELLTALTHKGRNLAGPCPFCKGKSQRQFQVNLEKNAWYCFGCKAGGNVLDFVARREGLDVRGAALALSRWFELRLAEGAPAAPPPSLPAGAPEVPEEASCRENPPLTFTLKTLDAGHPNLANLGLGAPTLSLFGAGYCTKGLLKGRLAIPVHNADGDLVAYAGLAVQEDEAPRYLFPPNFHPALEVMNLNRLAELAGEDGPLYLVPEIEGVLRLAEADVTSVLGLFDGSLSSEQEEALRGALALFGRLVLVGEGFEDRSVARLARYAPVTWISELLPLDPLAEEADPYGLREVEA
jgi:DNA primase